LPKLDRSLDRANAGAPSPPASVRPLGLEVWRDYHLLEAIEEQSTITQRTLAARLGVALGLTNLYLKRLVKKGYVKCVTASPKRLRYVITPRGAAHKARLALDFMKYSLALYRDARHHVRRGLDGRLSRWNRVALYGTGEAAELAFLLLRESGVEPIAAFDETGDKQFLGMPVHRIAEHRGVAYDVLIVALLDQTQPAIDALISAGVARDKLVLLREDATSRRTKPVRTRSLTARPGDSE
jgi:DNA-binding MarR family transcriptional regulator